VLYGKWRPKGFDEVHGQDHIVRTLRNALATGQVAHAYLFSGPRGTGKTTTARILARALNCGSLKDGEPCNECASCRAILNGSALDLIEMDAASNRGIEDIRELREKIAFAPSDLKRKVYLLDEVHMLTDGAFNALLKTLEEPPPHAVFILATTDMHKVPATIISRCQRHDFHRINNDASVARLEFIAKNEGFEFSREALAAISVQSRGGLRDAITLMEQVVARYGNAPSLDDVLAAMGQVHDTRTTALVRAILEDDLGAALEIARSVADDGIDIGRFTKTVIGVIRDILPSVIKGAPKPEDPHAELVTEAVGANGVRKLSGAMAELARADFRLDPASAIPLEVACATAILGGGLAPAGAAMPAAAAGGAPSKARAEAPPAGGQAAPRIPADAPLTAQERFARELYDLCKVENARLAMWLGSKFEVLQMDGEVVELGFERPMPMEKVLAGKAIVEGIASRVLGRTVTLSVKLLEGPTQPTRETRRGHLAEAARAIGATPVGKEQ
jgi:DNA polymerase-3 subunit gamma/tau